MRARVGKAGLAGAAPLKLLPKAHFENGDAPVTGTDFWTATGTEQQEDLHKFFAGYLRHWTRRNHALAQEAALALNVRCGI